MSDEPLDRRDALASEILDGLAAEEAGALDDPEVAARVARLRAARAAVRQPVAPPPAAARDAAIAAALAVADDGLGGALQPADPSRAGEEPSREPVPVTPLRRSRPGPRWLGAAAAAVVVLLGAVALVAALGDGSDDDDVAAVADQDSGDAAEEADTFGDDAASAEAFTHDLEADDPGPVTLDAGAGSQDAAGRIDLGDHDDLDQLAEAALEVVDDSRARTTAGLEADGGAGAGPSADPCATVVDRAADDGTLELDAEAVLDGAAVRALVVSNADGDRVLRVLDPTTPTCPEIARRGL